MSEPSVQKPKKIPGPDHPITITRSAHRIVVRAAGKVIADTRHALTLREADYAAVHYIPRSDVDMAQLARTEHASYCPYKGEASYFTLTNAGGLGTNAVWTYEKPYPAVGAITDHVAFYPDRVDAIEELPLS